MSRRCTAIVRAPIPAIGAEPGDWVHIDLDDADRPVTVASFPDSRGIRALSGRLDDLDGIGATRDQLEALLRRLMSGLILRGSPERVDPIDAESEQDAIAKLLAEVEGRTPRERDEGGAS